MLATLALLAACSAARAEHFRYEVQLSGTFSLGGTDGCYPPDFDQPACPRPGSLTAFLSFDTPTSADGVFFIGSDVTNFMVTLGYMPEDSLLGGIQLNGGIPSGTVLAADESERFTFDWGDHSASYSYDYGYHEANGSFAGTLSAVPEPAGALPLLAALAALYRRRRKGGPRA